ncbi:AAA family ATPase [Pseudoalteromonas sp. SWYJZ19]|uniref:AAA family ATPase n=1 Tax=Pseudoalteromonas sp. SWYJZ19 TaxID=2792068 RepID=UPI0018CF619D|nr:AAA family ATPase [Pseudoalteromonas sp. SWYJZ19]MBH0052021.1 AAA family ATPase [Pseudoalteromonas sp. SWYJZ19]
MKKELCVQKLIIEGLHGVYSYDLDFKSNLNILYGENGSGKSTVLHIIANILNWDFAKFVSLNFQYIYAFFDDQSYIEIIRFKDDNDDDAHFFITGGYKDSSEKLNFSESEAIDLLKGVNKDRGIITFEKEITHPLQKRIDKFCHQTRLKKVNTSYFPAFRTMLEAWSHKKSPNQVESFAREIFGHFLPQLNYPTPVFVEESLGRQYHRALYNLSEKENEIFSASFLKMLSKVTNKSSVPIHDAINTIEKFELHSKKYLNSISLESSSKINAILESVKNLCKEEAEGENDSLSGALEVYLEALEEINLYKYNLFSKIDTFINNVNFFLKNKKLKCSIEPLDEDRESSNTKLAYSRVRVGFDVGTKELCKSIDLSSGERQILTMLWAVNQVVDNTVVLIDEPEISLHIDWQEDLIKKMGDGLKSCQLIICTHSPAIAADYDGYMQEVKPTLLKHGK